MNSGFHLTLMIGPVVPVPVPQEVLDALTSVSVTTNSDSGSGFQLEFTLSNRSPLQTIFLLAGGASIPLVRVLIIVTVNGKADVLDGRRDDQSRDPSRRRRDAFCPHCDGRRFEPRDGLHRLQRLPVSRDAARSARGSDPAEVCFPRDPPAGHPQRAHRHPDPDRSHSGAAGERSRLHPRRSRTRSATSFTSIRVRSQE